MAISAKDVMDMRQSCASLHRVTGQITPARAAYRYRIASLAEPRSHRAAHRSGADPTQPLRAAHSVNTTFIVPSGTRAVANACAASPMG